MSAAVKVKLVCDGGYGGMDAFDYSIVLPAVRGIVGYHIEGHDLVRAGAKAGEPYFSANDTSYSFYSYEVEVVGD